MAKRGKLTRAQIVETATELLERYGEAGFSMRKLAGELGVDPMAIYHHHANRNALMGEVVEAFLSRCRIPKPSGDWAADVRAACCSLRALAKQHPDLFRLYEAHDAWVPAENAIQEVFYASLRKAGFPDQTVVRAVRLLLSYTESFAVDEIAGWHDPLDASDRSELSATLSADLHPAMVSLADKISVTDADADFAFGLDVIVRGLEAERL